MVEVVAGAGVVGGGSGRGVAGGLGVALGVGGAGIRCGCGCGGVGVCGAAFGVLAYVRCGGGSAGGEASSFFFARRACGGGELGEDLFDGGPGFHVGDADKEGLGERSAGAAVAGVSPEFLEHGDDLDVLRELEGVAEAEIVFAGGGGDVDDRGIGAARADEHERSRDRDHVVAEGFDAAAFAEEFVEGLEYGGDILCGGVVEEFEDLLILRGGQDIVEDGGGELSGRDGEQLVEDAEGIAHGAVGEPGDSSEDGFVGAGALFADDMGEPVGDGLGADVAEVEALAAALDGGGYFLDFGGGEDELDVLGRLFEGLQQRVERAG